MYRSSLGYMSANLYCGAMSGRAPRISSADSDSPRLSSSLLWELAVRNRLAKDSSAVISIKRLDTPGSKDVKPRSTPAWELKLSTAYVCFWRSSVSPS